MKIKAAYLIVALTGLALATQSAARPSKPTPTDFCHQWGLIASSAAAAREKGISLPKFLEKMRAGHKDDEAGQWLKETTENIIIEFYKSGLSESDAYIKMRETCIKNYPKS